MRNSYSKHWTWLVGCAFILSSCIGYVTTYEGELLVSKESRLQAHTNYGDVVPKYKKSVQTYLYPDSLEMISVRKKEVFNVDYGEYHLDKIKINTFPRPYPYISPLDTLLVPFGNALSGKYGVGGDQVRFFTGYNFIDSVHFNWVGPPFSSPTSTPPRIVQTKKSKPLIKPLGFTGKYRLHNDTLQMYEQRSGTILIDTTFFKMIGDTLFLIRTNDDSMKGFKKMYKDGGPVYKRQ